MFQFCWSESYSENTKRENEREKTVATTAIEVRVNENCVVKSRQESVLVIDVNDGDYDNIGFSANSNTHFFPSIYVLYSNEEKETTTTTAHK